ncbi:riboflavin synthase [Dioszegia hungarica]|uniref:Riboflavin synthase n=1 Tax=Dioszegia hungarica TaxID=4972 RepID=A0AA38H8V9_9TREE|nr:riboflavin synthase [Dioszegia hungarica]KAI9634464.1 riboflavin synthase [Dioszegia hungarica]
MFTGLVEHIATVSKIDNRAESGYDMIFSDAAPILNDVQIGDSICINGACLTVTEFGKDDGGFFRVGLANETLQRTNLGTVQAGSKVNCERAMSAHTRFGGHMVQGHVDSTATIVGRVPDGDSIRYTFQFPADRAALMPYLVEKGYVTVDGTSLTLTMVEDAERKFAIALIAHSQEKVVLTDKTEGDVVNIEVDCVGKYILGSEERINAMVERIVDARIESVLKAKGLM